MICISNRKATITVNPGGLKDDCQMNNDDKKKKRPLLFKYRSSKIFIFWTAAVGLFTSVNELIYSLFAKQNLMRE